MKLVAGLKQCRGTTKKRSQAHSDQQGKGEARSRSMRGKREAKGKVRQIKTYRQRKLTKEGALLKTTIPKESNLL